MILRSNLVACVICLGCANLCSELNIMTWRRIGDQERTQMSSMQTQGSVLAADTTIKITLYLGVCHPLTCALFTAFKFLHCACRILCSLTISGLMYVGQLIELTLGCKIACQFGGQGTVENSSQFMFFIGQGNPRFKFLNTQFTLLFFGVTRSRTNNSQQYSNIYGGCGPEKFFIIYFFNY